MRTVCSLHCSLCDHKSLETPFYQHRECMVIIFSHGKRLDAYVLRANAEFSIVSVPSSLEGETDLLGIEVVF